jgi:hypothetical protein
MARDIEEFLKMAAKRREELKRQAAGQQPAAPVPPAEPRKPPVQRKPPQQQKQRQQLQRQRPEPSADAYEESESDLGRYTVAEHVRQHLDTSDITQKTATLGQAVGLADDKLEAHLQQVFGHTVATLEKPVDPELAGVVDSRKVSPLARALVDLLRKPETIRQAILVSEILRRPEF